jgi:hypothetical protein
MFVNWIEVSRIDGSCMAFIIHRVQDGRQLHKSQMHLLQSCSSPKFKKKRNSSSTCAHSPSTTVVSIWRDGSWIHGHGLYYYPPWRAGHAAKDISMYVQSRLTNLYVSQRRLWPRLRFIVKSSSYYFFFFTFLGSLLRLEDRVHTFITNS